MRVVSSLLILCFLGLPANSLAEDDSSMFRVPFKFQKGESIILEIFRTREGGKNPFGSTTEKIQVKVLDTSKTDTIFSWRNLSTSISNKDFADTPFAKAAAEISKETDLELKYTVNPPSLELINFEEVKTKAIEVIELYANTLSENKEFTPAQVAQFKSFLKYTFSSKEYAEAKLLNSVNLFFLPYSHSFYLDDTTMYEGELPLPGGRMVKTIQEFKIEEYDEKKGILIVDWAQIPKSRAKLNKTVKGFIDEAGETIDKKENTKEDDMEIPLIDISDIGKFSFDLVSGWPKQVFFERSTTSPVTAQKDKFEFKLLEHKKAES